MFSLSNESLISIAVIAISSLVYLVKRSRKVLKDNASTVWVVGASSGIGKEVAIQYALDGKKVILSSRHEDQLKELQQTIMKQTQKTEEWYPIICVDVEKDEEFPSIAQNAISQLKSIDILVISSGLGIRAFNDETTAEVEKKMMQTNYMGPILLAKAVLPYMRQRHTGTVVFISSIQGLLSIPARSSYSGAKHALQGYCNSLRAEESINGINILTVSPAYVKTNHSLNSIRGDGKAYNKMDSTTKKGMEPSDLAVMIRKAVIEKKGNLIVAPFYMKAVNILQYIFPSAVELFMNKKAQKAHA